MVSPIIVSIAGGGKAFDDPFVENEFAVRGGMCWFQHVLIAAVEAQDSHQVSRIINIH